MPRATSFAAPVFATLLAVCAGAGAAQLPKQIDAAVREGAKVVRTFPAASGLKGWVLSRNGRYSLVYSTPDGKTLLVGELIDNDSGTSLSDQYYAKYVPQPDPEALYGRLERSKFIAEGTLKSPKSVIYVLFDPNCPFCHLAWKALQPYERAGLQVRWIPVAYLMASSPGKAAAIMEAKDRSAALRENEENYDLSRHQGGIEALASPSASTLRQLRANGELMRAFGANGTPTLVRKDAQGKIRVNVGMPRLSRLAGITGLPEQSEDDPSLARFR